MMSLKVSSTMLVIVLLNLSSTIAVSGQFNIQVKLYTSESKENPVLLNNSTQAYLFEPALKCFSNNRLQVEADCEYFMIIHGYKSNSEVDWVARMRQALFTRNENSAILVVDWSAGADLSVFKYKEAAENVRFVFPYLNSVLRTLIDNGYLRPDRMTNTLNMHCIGHSLGAHTCGLLGKLLKNSQSLALSRISGLDPAGPCFDSHSSTNRLDKADANYVDVIHTSRTFGMTETIGHIDFYPNQGTKQPDCWPWPLARSDDQRVSIYTTLWCNNKIEYETNDTAPALEQLAFEQTPVFVGEGQRIASLCSHGRAIEYYIESINSDCKFLSYQCSSWTNYEKNLCQECDTNTMGFKSERKDKATFYYLKVNSESPWCVSRSTASPPNDSQLSFLKMVVGGGSARAAHSQRKSTTVSDICIYSTASRLTMGPGALKLQNFFYLVSSFLLLKLVF